LALIEPWLNIDEIAAYLKISKVTVYRMVKAKVFPVYRVGKGWRTKASLLDEWVKNGTKPMRDDILL
jgi:excisionase family DNA binding protein